MGMPFSAPIGLLFIMYYLGFSISIKKWIAILIIPFISLIMVATNDWHQFHYRVYEVDPVLGAPYVLQEIGTWYVIHGIFTFSSMFVALYLLLSQWRETAKVYRPQLISLIIGQLVPMVTAFIYLIGWTPPGVDPVPMVLWFSSLLYLWSISSSRMFRIMPIAKATIFNSINDGVIVLDESGRLIEFNQASKGMFPSLSKTMFGMDFDEVWQGFSGDRFPFKLEAKAYSQELKHRGNDQQEYTYQVHTTPLQHANHLSGLLLIFTDITEIKRLQVKLEHQAYYDELTQIYNRRAFFQHCNQNFAEAKEAATPFTVILMDIDHFKKVNDTYGHFIGDLVLKHVVKMCQNNLEAGELFARYGGEEFVLALNGCSSVEGEALATKLRHYVEAHPLTTTAGTISVTLSLGVAEATHESEETIFQLLNNADTALYLAKEEGRNEVYVYGSVGSIV